MSLGSSCSCLCAIYWSQVLSWEWRCSWSSADSPGVISEMIPQIYLFSKFNLENPRSRSRIKSSRVAIILLIHNPLVSYQSVHPFLKYNYFKIWPWVNFKSSRSSRLYSGFNASNTFRPEQYCCCSVNGIFKCIVLKEFSSFVSSFIIQMYFVCKLSLVQWQLTIIQHWFLVIILWMRPANETTLHCNAVSLWLGAYTKWSLGSCYGFPSSEPIADLITNRLLKVKKKKNADAGIF